MEGVDDQLLGSQTLGDFQVILIADIRSIIVYSISVIMALKAHGVGSGVESAYNRTLALMCWKSTVSTYTYDAPLSTTMFSKCISFTKVYLNKRIVGSAN